MTYPAIAEAYRERVLRALASNDIYAIMREIGHPADKDNAVKCREYLLKNWNDDIRDRVLKIIKDNIEVTQ